MINFKIKNLVFHFLLVFIIVLLVFINGCKEQKNYDDFVTCLTDGGAVFYGTEWCGHCQNQKEMFENSIDLVNFVDCDVNSDICKEEGINLYPTWVIEGEKYPGVQKFSRLSYLTGCEIGQ